VGKDVAYGIFLGCIESICKCNISSFLSLFECQKSLQLSPLKLAYFQSNSLSLSKMQKYGFLDDFGLKV